ncbi:MAG TPA: hypothetical protein VHK88_20645, partial [Aquihabitans sp.]|nr:hypothetical protein [Aquihabitans sp.]
LGADAVRLLSAAAVAGTSAPLDVLAGASGLDGLAVLDALDEAIAAGLLAEEGAADAVVFPHAIVQHVIVDRLSGVRRRGIHLAVAEAYVSSGGRALDVAHHLFEAGAQVPADRLAAAALAASREALSLFAYEATVAWAGRALAVEGAADPTLRCRSLVALSAAQRALGDREAARVAANQATEAARAAGDPLLLASAAEAVMLAWAGLGFDFATADQELHALLAEVLRGLAGDGPAPELHDADPLEGGPWGLRWLPRDALAVAEANGQHALVATAHLAVRMSIWRVDTLPQRLEADRAAVAAAERGNQPLLLLNALLYLATDLTEAGDVREASTQLERIREVARRVRQPAYDAFADFFAAQQALARGDYERSSELADRALAVGRHSHGIIAELAWAGQVFIRAWDEGRLAGMVDILDGASGQTATTIFRVARSVALVAAGRGEETRATLAEDLQTCWLDVNRDSVWLAIGGLYAEIARALDEPAAAQVVIDHLRPYAGRIAVTGLGRASLGPVDRFIGVAAGVVGDHELAVESLRAAVALARRAGATAHEARALHDLALAVEAAGGSADEADRHRAEADALAAPIGLVPGPIGATAAV